MSDIGYPDRDQPFVWTKLKESIQRWSEGSDIILDCSRNWDDLNEADDDTFRNGLVETNTYAAFLVRALVGSPEKSDPLDSASIVIAHGSSDQPPSVTVPAQIVSFLVKHIRIDKRALIGADLVARVALTTTRRISKASNCSIRPVLDCCKSAGQLDYTKLRCLSADFVVAKTTVPHRKRVAGAENGCCPNIYYHYGWLEDGPPADTWVSHGWRAKTDRKFTNNPNEKKRDKEIETFLGFPAFFKHDEANIVFSLPHSRDLPKYDCPSYGTLLDQGIAPYVREKGEEYLKRAKQNGSIKGCVVLCVGVSGQRTAYFDPSDLASSYGIFLTMDLECAENECRTAGCSDPQIWDDIVNELREARYRIKYEALQVLTGGLLEERDEQHRELQKYEQMFDLLGRPLYSLTEALARTQADTQLLRAILYEPQEAIFACQPQIAELFENSKSIPELGLKVAHNVGDYTDLNRASSVLALALARFRGLSQVDGACDLQAQVSFFRHEDEDHSGPYHKLSKRLRGILGIASWDAMENIDLTDTRKYLQDIKGRFHTPYKPSDVQTSSLKWTVLRSFLEDEQVNGVSCTCNDNEVHEQDQFVLVAKGGSPFCTYGHLIEFICGVIGPRKVWVTIDMSCQLVLQPGGLKLDTDNANKVRFTLSREAGSGAWIEDGPSAIRLVDVLNSELTNKRRYWGGGEEHGDFHAPFIKLIRRIPEWYVDATQIANKDGVTIQFGSSMTMKFQGPSFIVESAQ